MVASTDKEELAARLAISRAKMSGDFAGLQKNLAVGTRLKRSLSENRLAWVSGAVVVGFLLSRIPGRRARNPKLDFGSSKFKPEKQSLRAAFLLAGLKIAVDLLKPALIAGLKNHLAKQFNDKAEFHVPPKKPSVVAD